MPRLKLGSVNRCDRKPMGFCLLDKAEGARLRDFILGSIPTDVEEEWLLRPKAPSAWGTKECQAVRTGLTVSCRNTRVTGWHAHACSAAFFHATPCTSLPCHALSLLVVPLLRRLLRVRPSADASGSGMGPGSSLSPTNECPAVPLYPTPGPAWDFTRLAASARVAAVAIGVEAASSCCHGW